MSQDNKGKDLSITDLLKKLREQADAEADPTEEETAENIASEREETVQADEEETEIRTELSRILAMIGGEAKEKNADGNAEPEAAFTEAEMPEAEENTGCPAEKEHLPEKPAEEFLPEKEKPSETRKDEKSGEADGDLKDLILRLNQKKEEILSKEVSDPKNGINSLDEEEAEQISFFDGLFDEITPEPLNPSEIKSERSSDGGLLREENAEDTFESDNAGDEADAERNESLRELISMIDTENHTEADQTPPAKTGGSRYHFTVSRKNDPTAGSEDRAVPSAKEYEEAKQDIADFSEEKAETKEAPSLSGWKMLKNLFGFGKNKEETADNDAEENEDPDEISESFADTSDGTALSAEETEEKAFGNADIFLENAEEGGTETSSDRECREDDDSFSDDLLPPKAKRTEEGTDSGIAPDPELFDRIREEYPIAMNDMGTTAPVGNEETQSSFSGISREEDEAESETADEDAEPISDGDLDRMMKRFLTKENYEEYAKGADLAESRRRMGQIRLDDPGTAPSGAEKEDVPRKKGDTKEVPKAAAESGKEDPDAKELRKSLFDSETFVPPEIDAEEELSEEEIDKDISILVAFGREEEARKKYGDERVDAFLSQVSGTGKEKREEEPEEETELTDVEETEYENFSQNKDIFRNFKKKYRFSLIRLVLCGILLLLAFFLENYSLLGMAPIGALDPELLPLIYVMADLQLLVFGCLIARRPIIDGAKSLLRREPEPTVFVSAASFFCVAYTVYAAFLPAGQIRLYTFSFLLLCFVCLLCEFFDLRREIMTFRVVSSKRSKYVIGSLSEEEASLEEEAFENYLPEDPMLFKLGKAKFVDGFFRRLHGKSTAKKLVLLVPPFACAVGVAFLAMSLCFGSETDSAVTTGITAFMMSLPAAMFLTFSYPFYTAAGHAYDTDSAIVGEPSLEEYCDAASVSFEDTDVFPSRGVKVRSVMVFGENRIDEVINNVTSVFHVAGGPLSDVLDIITSDLRTDEDTRLLSVAPDGIEADVSGTHMYLGKADYLRRNHYVPIVSEEDREIERSGSLSIMYVVSGDEVVAKFYLSYRIDPDFEKILKQMYRSGICVGIKTFDPNIDDDMLSRRIRIERYPVRVLKCREIGDEPRVADRADSGIVSKRSTKALLGAFAVCGKVQTATRIGIVLNFISLFAAAMVMGVTMLFGAADKIPSLYVSLYQLFWTVPIFVMSRLHVK